MEGSEGARERRGNRVFVWAIVVALVGIPVGFFWPGLVASVSGDGWVGAGHVPVPTVVTALALLPAVLWGIFAVWAFAQSVRLWDAVALVAGALLTVSALAQAGWAMFVLMMMNIG